MTAPPKDDDGIVIPHDTEDIRAECKLVRDFPRNQYVYDNNMKCHRPSSAAMNESSASVSKYGGLSVNNADDILAVGNDPLDYLRSSSFGAAELIAGPVRKINLMVGREPTPENSFHCNIWGISSKKIKKTLAKMARVIKEPG